MLQISLESCCFKSPTVKLLSIGEIGAILGLLDPSMYMWLIHVNNTNIHMK